MSNTLYLRRQQRFPRCTLQRFNLSLSLLLLFLFASTRSSLSTTICAIQYCDGVVIGADSRSTSGGMVMNKEVSKIRRLAARSALAGAGVSAVCSHVSSQVSLDLARIEMRESLAGEREGGNEEELTATSTSSTRVLHALRRALNAVFLRNEKFNANLESVFICGCVSREGPSLFLVHSDGAHESIPFGAFGSGAIDALALLESFHHRLSSGNEEGRKRIQEDEAVEAVRAAVRAGILNDLGSGSHVDLCVIDAKKGFFQWRERLKPTASNDSTQPAPLRAVDIGQRLHISSSSSSSSAQEPSHPLRPRGISVRPLPLSSLLSDQT